MRHHLLDVSKEIFLSITLNYKTLNSILILFSLNHELTKTLFKNWILYLLLCLSISLEKDQNVRKDMLVETLVMRGYSQSCQSGKKGNS